MTIASARIALSVTAVSISVSPFFTLDCAACMLTTSAPSRLPAISKLSSVRVEFSKNALMIVSPASLSACFFVCAVERDPLLGLVEQVEDLVSCELTDAEQAAMRERLRAGRIAARSG